MGKPQRISIFGDSILKGVQLSADTHRYCVSDRIDLQSIANRYSLALDNRSRFGCTIEKGAVLLRRFLPTAGAGDAVLIEYGGNDADFDWEQVSQHPYEEHLPHTPLPRFRALLTELIGELRQNGLVPILVNLPPISSERYLDWITGSGLSRANILQWLGDANAIYRYQEQYSHAIEQIAAEQECLCVDVRGAFLHHRSILPLLCEDGIHPNDVGQRLLHDAFAEAAERHISALSTKS